MIDAGNDRRWLPTVTAQLGTFRQGSLVALPPFAYHAVPRLGLWQATKMLGEVDDTVLVELDSGDLPPHGIITTQSCDVDEEGRNTKPWVQLAPVYQLSVDDPRVAAVKRWQVHYLAPVTALGDNWVADLRIEVPVEKSWLVTQRPQNGFATQEEFRRFGWFCGVHRSRPGIATEIYDHVLEPLEQEFRRMKSEQPQMYETIMDQLDHLFIEVFDDPLNPFYVKLIFASRLVLPESVTDALDDWWGEKFEHQPLEFTVMQSNYRVVESLSFTETRPWYEQDIGRLTASS